MTNKTTVFLIASSAFAGGLAAGLFTASKTGRATCGRLADVMRAQSRLFETRLRGLQDQVRTLERQVGEAGHHVTERLAGAGEHALAYYLPSLPDDPASWEVHRGEMTRDLPRLPRV